MDLLLDSQFDDADEFYAALVHAHDGLSDRQGAVMDRHLVLLLANQVGEVSVLRKALELARGAALAGA